MKHSSGRWTAVLVFSGCGFLPRRSTSGPQPVGRQGTGGRITDVCLAVSRRARVAAALAYYGWARPRKQHRARPARGGVSGGCGRRRDGARGCGGLQRDGRTMGVLPAGSGNDYVKALGVGTGLRRALEVLVEGRVRVVDTAVVNGVPFNNGLGIGFDAEVAAGVTRAPAYLGGT